MTRNYWTPERDEELKRHKAAGLSASKIATLLHTTRNAVLGRTNRLRNRPSPAKIELKRQKTAAAEARKKAVAEKRQKAAAQAREQAQALQEKILAAIRADFAAGVDRSVAIQRAIRSGAKSTAIAEFFGLSRWQVYQIGGPVNTPSQWTDQQVKLLLSLWSDHSAQEIADALGTTRGAVLGKIWRVGMRSRKGKSGGGRASKCRSRV